jgi:hypothetical protein
MLPRQGIRRGVQFERDEMSEWEYQKVDLNVLTRTATDLDLLDKAGDEGWELVVITPNSIAYLKRPITKPKTRKKT